MPWISVRHWRRFQHYDPSKRQPPWIKTYTELTRSDEYLGLGASERAVLHGIWLEYASSQCALRFDPTLIGRRLNLRVRKQHLESLCDAGFLDIVASKTLAEGYHDASARAHDVEVETEEEKNPAVDVGPTRNGSTAEQHTPENEEQVPEPRVLSLVEKTTQATKRIQP